MIIIGVDTGTSGVKVTGWRDGEFFAVRRFEAVKNNNQLNNVIEIFLKESNVNHHEVECVAMTGVSAANLNPDYPAEKVMKISEFTAIARGGLVQTQKREACVISMGTGTAYVVSRMDEDGSVSGQHLGGTGVGGGFIAGISSRLLGMDSVFEVSELAKKGDVKNTDLRLCDVSDATDGMLYPQITVSNFGKVESTATDADIAAGLLNLVFQIIGMMAVFGARGEEIKDFVLVGALAEIEQAKTMMVIFEQVYGFSFTIPEAPEFSVAKGAVYEALYKKSALF